jgi:hypothetical protein
MKMIENIKGWSVQKKIFAGLASATIITGATYGVIKLADYVSSQKSKKKKTK